MTYFDITFCKQFHLATSINRRNSHVDNGPSSILVILGRVAETMHFQPGVLDQAVNKNLAL